MTRKSLKINISAKKLLNFLVVSNIMFFASYLFFVGATTIEVVNRKNIEESTKILQSSRASLEQTYNESSKMYTKDYARTLGFVEVVPMFYATKNLNTVAYEQGGKF